MMQGDMHKVNAEHLKRSAYLYIRQSTPRQVLENTESTKRQYALRHAKSVPANVIEHLLRSGERSLGVDHPFDALRPGHLPGESDRIAKRL